MDRTYKIIKLILFCVMISLSWQSAAQGSCYAAGSNLSFTATPSSSKSSSIQGGCSDGSFFDWQVGTKPNWLNAYRSGSSVVVTVSNNTGGSRSGSISLVKNGSQIGTFTVSQAAGLVTVGQVSITSGSTQRCNTGSTDYNASATNATSYSWSLSPSSAGTINSNGNVTWNGSNFSNVQVKVTAYGPNNSSSNATRNVSFVGLSTPSLQSNTAEFCDGESATLTLGPLQSSVRYELLLNGAATGFDVTTNSSGSPGGVTWNVTNGGTYSIRATQQSGAYCSFTYGSRNITKKAGLGNPSISGPNQLCSGIPTTDFGIYGDNGSNSYSWSILNGGPASINSSTGRVNWNGFTGTATIRLSVTAQCGNTTTKSKSVSFNLISTPGLQTNSNEFCNGESATLTLGPLQSSVRYELLLNGAATGFDVITNSSGSPGGVTWNVTNGGTYSIRATQQTGAFCSITYGSLNIIKKAGLGNPSIKDPGLLCSGTEITDFNILDDNGSNSYSWSILNGGPATINSGTGVVNWNGFMGSATIRLSVTAQCGNTTTKDRPVSFNLISTPGLQSSSNEFCDGESVTLTLGPLENGVTYKLIKDGSWTNLEVDGSEEGGISWTVYEGGEYYYEANQQNSPYCTIEHGWVNITKKQNLGNPIIISENTRCRGAGSSTLSIDNGSDLNQYVWNLANAGSSSILGSGTNATINWDANFEGTGNVIVNVISECGNSTDLNMAISVTPPKIWSMDTDFDGYPDKDVATVESCEAPNTGNWTSDPKPFPDYCPDYFNNDDYSNGCNPDCLQSISLSQQLFEFTHLGGNQILTYEMPNCASGYNINIENSYTDWLQIVPTAPGSNTFNVICEEGSEVKDVFIAVTVNGNQISGNTGFGITVKRGAEPVDPDPDPDPTCTISGVSNISFPAAGSYEEFTPIFNPTSCQQTLYLKAIKNGQIADVPGWLNYNRVTGNTFKLEPGPNNTGNIKTETLVFVDINNQGFGGFNFNVTQTSCQSISWYLDSDGDGKGDVYGVPIVGCNDPDDDVNDDPNDSWVSNNEDLCPYEAATGYANGCLNGNAPEKFNTITTKAFDVTETLKGANKSYFDELGKPIQSQSWNIRTNDTWVSETKYDEQGRPALQTLSAPVRSGNNFVHKDGFMEQTNNATTYSQTDFTGNYLENPNAVGNATEGSLGWYYSENNSREQYQDITTHPFVSSVFSNLNPGAVLRSVGGNKIDTNKNGVIDDGDTWVQAYSFTMRATDELSVSAAFGTTQYNDDKLMKTVVRDVNGFENVVISNTDGQVLASAKSGADGTTSLPMVLTINEQGYVDVHIPVGISGITVSNLGAVTVYDLITEQTVDNYAALDNGFYRVAVNNLDGYNPDNAPITVTYRVNYYDYSLNEYDEAGRLTHTYQPLTDGNGDKLVSTFEYNTLGQLIKTTSVDQGTIEFIYREDGQIRFSQNTEQAKVNEVSFTDYDPLGRSVESGVMLGATFSTLNVESSSGTNKKEQVFTHYDEIPVGIDITTILSANYQSPRFLAGNVAVTSRGNGDYQTFYSYDVYGRVEWIAQDMQGLGVKTIDYVYEPITGLLEYVYYQKDENDQFIHKYNYDVANQLSMVQTSVDGNNWETHAEYLYYETGELKRTELAGGVQGLDYVYSLDGKLKSLNHPSLNGASDPNGDSNDLFGMQLDYHVGDYMRTSNTNIEQSQFGTDKLNGNIKGMRWKNASPLSGVNESEYVYEYDRNNWLQSANFDPGNTDTSSGLLVNDESTTVYTIGQSDILEATQSYTLKDGFHAQEGSTIMVRIDPNGGGSSSGDYDVTNITYDVNGNIQSLARNAQGPMDNLTYEYKTDKPNQLLRVDDSIGDDIVNNVDIDDQDGSNYIYNDIGQLIYNTAEEISYIYNTSGLVTEVKKGIFTAVKFYYNDKNHRVRKETFDNSGSSVYSTYYVRDVSGQVMAIYSDFGGSIALTEQPVYGAGRIGVAYNGTNNTKQYVYEMTDHLGNVRAVFTKNGINANLEGVTDYYPFGMPMLGRDMTGANQYRYSFQGQEKDSETGKEAFELRLWDSRIGRWLTTDPMSEFASPFLGMGNNPVYLTDPNGGMTDGCCDSAWKTNTYNELDGSTVTGVNKLDSPKGLAGLNLGFIIEDWSHLSTKQKPLGPLYPSFGVDPLAPGAAISLRGVIPPPSVVSAGYDFAIPFSMGNVYGTETPLYGIGFEAGYVTDDYGNVSWFYTKKLGFKPERAMLGIDIGMYGINSLQNTPFHVSDFQGYGEEEAGSLFIGYTKSSNYNVRNPNSVATYSVHGLSYGLLGPPIGAAAYQTHTTLIK